MLDAIVVGAGPAGAVAALVMARAGARVLILESADAPRAALCGGLLSPGAVQLLSTLDLDPSGLSPYAIRGWRVITPRGRVHECPVGTLQPLAIGRPAFDAWLLEAAIAAGARFQSGVRVRGPLLDESSRRVRGVVAVRRGSELRLPASMVIAADGRRSGLARHTGVRLGPVGRRRVLDTSVAGVLNPATHVEIHVGAGAYCRVTPVAVDRLNVQIVASRQSSPDAAALVAAFMKERPQLAARVAWPSGTTWRWSGLIEVRTSAPGVPGLLLAGDAARSVSPLSGEGIKLAMLGGQLAAEEAVLAIEFGDFEGAVARLAAARDRMGRGRRLARLLAGGLQRAALAEAGAMAGRLVPGLMSPLFDDTTATS